MIEIKIDIGILVIQVMNNNITNSVLSKDISNVFIFKKVINNYK